MNSIGKIILKYRKDKNLSQKEVSEQLRVLGTNVTNKSISTWEKDTAEPNASSLLNLCRILEIPDIYEEYFGSNPNNMLSELNREGREKALDYIRLLIDSARYQPPAPAPILPFQRKLRLFDIPVSAGTGNFLDSDCFSEIEVGEEVPSSADFGIRISGDSMEPQFTNGQIVWIQQQEALLDGEIGIFSLDDNAYCKKFQKNEQGLFLISLNKKYHPIPVSENASFKIFGKVLG